MSRRTVVLAGAMVAAGLMLAATAGAQDRGWGPHWGMMSEGPGWHFGRGWWRSEDRIDRIDGRLAYLKAELRIDDRQTPTWNSFADAVKTSVKAHNDAMRDFPDDEDREAALPEQLGQRIAFMEARLAEMKALKQAGERLYAELSEEQKKIADEILLPAMGPGSGGMWRWMHG